MKFLYPYQPIATCKSESCDDCLVSRTLNCHSSAGDLLTFLLIICPAIVLGSAGIYNIDGAMLISWLVILIGYIGFVELRGIDSHCAPDTDKERVSKIWKYRSWPMTIRKKVMFLSGFALVWGYPIYFLIYGHQIFLLIAYLVSTTSFFVTLKLFLCSRCINFACPLNAVDDYVRSDFYECNPGVTKLWNRKKLHPNNLSGITQIRRAKRVIAQPMKNEV